MSLFYNPHKLFRQSIVRILRAPLQTCGSSYIDHANHRMSECLYWWFDFLLRNSYLNILFELNTRYPELTQVRLVKSIANPSLYQIFRQFAGKLTQPKTIVSAFIFFLHPMESQTRQSSCPSHLLQTRISITGLHWQQVTSLLLTQKCKPGWAAAGRNF